MRKKNNIRAMSSLKVNDSKLLQHSYEYKSGSTTFVFYSYYNAQTPIYYELRPFVTALKFANADQVINDLPKEWICTAGTFNDARFKKAKIKDSTEFGLVEAIDRLAINADKNQAFIENVHNKCFKYIQELRMQNLNDIIAKLSDRIEQLENLQDHHKTTLGTLHKLLTDVSDTHSNLAGIITGALPDIAALFEL